MKSTADKIRELSLKAATDKAAEESKKIQERIDKDMEVLEKILAMVKDRLIYKVVDQSGYSIRKKYIVVTEDIVLQDYSEKNDRIYSGRVAIERVKPMFGSYEYTQINVNGHYYYHAADMIEKYKHEANKAMEKAKREYDAAQERKEAIDNLAELEPVVKELMLNYNKHLGYLDGEAE